VVSRNARTSDLRPFGTAVWKLSIHIETVRAGSLELVADKSGAMVWTREIATTTRGCKAKHGRPGEPTV